jgi:hypothetical protein
MRVFSVALAVLLVAATGCGKAKPTAEETAPFLKAIEAYLSQQSMDMRADAFTSLAIDKTRATAEVQMAAKDVSYGMRPRWRFTFEKKDDAWQVTQVDR